jgi:hypothetical protein
MTRAPERSWFRFSLRTLFLVVTLLGSGLGWLGYCLQWINQRHEFMENPPTPFLHVAGRRTAPWPLVMFGQHGFGQISISFVPWASWDEKGYRERPLSAEESAQLNRVKRLFPEAIVSTTPLDSRNPKYHSKSH